MLLNIVRAKSLQGKKEHLDASFPLDEELISSKGYKFLTDVHLVGEYAYEDEELSLSALCEVTLNCVCDNCGEEFETVLRFPLNETFVEDYNSTDDDDYVISHVAVDLTKPVEDAFLLALPTKMLCKENCKGLCEICGKNKNLYSCSCAEIQKELEQDDNPFSKIKK